MAVDKLVDSTQLDSDLALVADAIREKTGDTALLAFPDEYVDAIGSISGGGGGGWIDPMDYYRENRPAEWPTVPLPSAMENPDDPAYVGNKTKIVLLYKKTPGAVFLTDKIQLTGTNIAAEIQKYADADTPVGSAETIAPSGSGTTWNVEFVYTDADTDFADYSYALLTITADTMTGFGYSTVNMTRTVNGYPLRESEWGTALVELSGTAPGLSSIEFGKNLVKYPSNIVFFSLGKNSLSSMYRLFYNCISLKAVLELDTSAVTNMSDMFNACAALQTIPVLDTSAVTNMSTMFFGCAALQTIPALDTSAATNMSSMFSGCRALQTIPVLDTSAVTNISSVFNACVALQTIPALDTSAATNMSSMFNGCRALQTIPVLDTSAATNMSGMFSGCRALQTIPALNTSKVTDMMNMFYGCASLQTVPALDTSTVTNISSVFYDCSALQTVPQFDIVAATAASSTFANCFTLQTIDIDNWDFTSASAVSTMFGGCYVLKALIIRGFGAGTVLNANTFNTCYHISGTTKPFYNPTGAHDGYIYVPDNMVETIKAATNWSTYASQIKGLSELPT